MNKIRIAMDTLSNINSTKCLQQSQTYENMTSDYNTIRQLLETSHTQNFATSTALSPNGTFKYVDREVAQRRYGGYLKQQQLIPNERIRRPLNCFMVFSHLERKRVAEEHPELHNADLSKILGKRWKSLTTAERQPYIDEAERIRLLHTEIYPDYKYQPRRKVVNKRSNKKPLMESADVTKDKLSDENDTATKNQQKISRDVNPQVSSHKSEERNQDTLPLDGNYFVAGQSEVAKENEMLAKQKNVQRSLAQSNLNQEFHVSASRRFENGNPNKCQGNVQQMTPDLSPASCYKEPVYNAAINNGIQGIQSLPPTPEMSPLQTNREESVFNFDPTCYSYEYYDSHFMKVNHKPQIDQVHTMCDHKNTFIPAHGYVSHMNTLNHPMQYNHAAFDPKYERPGYYQQNTFNQIDYSLIANQMNSMGAVMSNYENYGGQYENLV